MSRRDEPFDPPTLIDLGYVERAIQSVYGAVPQKRRGKLVDAAARLEVLGKLAIAAHYLLEWVAAADESQGFRSWLTLQEYARSLVRQYPEGSKGAGRQRTFPVRPRPAQTPADDGGTEERLPDGSQAGRNVQLGG